jgi:hypothetical protein
MPKKILYDRLPSSTEDESETENPATEKEWTVQYDQKKAPLLGLLQFASRYDQLLQILGCAAGVVAGSMMVGPIPSSLRLWKNLSLICCLAFDEHCAWIIHSSLCVGKS